MHFSTRNIFLFSSLLSKSHPSLQTFLHFRCSSSIPTLIPNLKYKRIIQRNRLIPARKPRWLPPAPSKLYRIPKAPDCPPDELAEILRLYRVHKTEVKSIRNYWINEYVKKTSGSDMELRQREEDLEHEKLMELNRLENERIAKLREERTRRLLEEEEERLLKADEELKETRARIQKEVDEIVRQEKLKSATYITRDKLEQAIQEAMDNPVTYNYAIDLDGNQYWEEPPSGFDEQKIRSLK